MTYDIEVLEVGPEHAGDVVRTIHAAFARRPTLDPPSTALAETEASVAAALAAHGGLLATDGGRAVGAVLLEPDDASLGLRRVSVAPEAQRRGVALALARAAEEVAHQRGFRRTSLVARAELPGTVRFWLRAGYREIRRDGTSLTMAKELPVSVAVPTADDMRMLGRGLSSLLRPGDLVILTGDLGAGKTTFTQGVGAGMGVRGDVTSPTFVISRVHPSLHDGPALVHVDAYRLGGLAELDDLDLDVSLEESVTVVEWGAGLAEHLADDRLEITLQRAIGSGESEARVVVVQPLGARWVGADVVDAVT